MKLSVCAAAMIALSAPAFAQSETWSCSFEDPEGPPPHIGQAVVVISGTDLSWQIEFPEIGAGGRPIPVPKGAGHGYEFSVASLEYKVIENTEAGVVAVVSQPPHNDLKIESRLSINAILLEKIDGRLRIGGITMDGHGVVNGKCTLKSQTRP